MFLDFNFTTVKNQFMIKLYLIILPILSSFNNKKIFVFEPELKISHNYNLIKKMKIRILCIILLVLKTKLSLAQGINFHLENYVPNASFEDKGLFCPDGINLGNLNDWIGPNTSSPDYKHVCRKNPNNGSHAYSPMHGDAYVALQYGTSPSSGENQVREYISIELEEKLVKDFEYELSMSVRCTEPGSHGFFQNYFTMSNIGMVLSEHYISASVDNGVILSTPQLEIQTLIQHGMWTTITTKYFATGNEKFITIGCFIDNPIYHSIEQSYSGPDVLAYIHIDDLKITPHF